MKKAVSILMSVVLVLGLAACGNGKNNGGQSVPEAAAESNESESSREETAEVSDEGFVQPEEISDDTMNESGESVSDEASAESSDVGGAGKALVVYYSATGNTEAVAGYIAAAADADLFELEPADPYSSSDLNWTDENSRVSQEYENPEKRAMELTAETVADWEAYDVVFIGYPIWWGIAAWPVDAFIAANDFTGKTVVPFCTSSTSGLGESGNLLAEMAGTGNWLEGERFSSRASEDSVKEWVEGLGL